MTTQSWFTVWRCGLAAIFVSAGLIACGPQQPADSGAVLAQKKTSPDAAKLKVYGIKSGKIEYQMTGLQNGRSIAVWDDWGLREVETIEGEVAGNGQSIPVRQLSLRTDEALISADLIQKTATKAANPIKTFLDQQDLEGGDDLGEKWIESMGGVRDGSDEIIGRTCDVWVVEQLRGKLCIWRGLMLRQEVKLESAVYTKEAIAIVEDVTPDPAQFVLPGDIKFAEDMLVPAQSPN